MKQSNEDLWKKIDVDRAKRCLYSCHKSQEDMNYLKDFLRNVELLKKYEVKQVARLLQ